MFQTSKPCLKRQQEILTALGFFHGTANGIWGPDSIAAMQQYEQDPSFKPCVPNGGMPLDEGRTLPAGIVVGHGGLMSHPSITT